MTHAQTSEAVVDQILEGMRETPQGAKLEQFLRPGGNIAQLLRQFAEKVDLASENPETVGLLVEAFREALHHGAFAETLSGAPGGW